MATTTIEFKTLAEAKKTAKEANEALKALMLSNGKSATKK